MERNYPAGARVELTVSAQSVSKLSLVTGATMIQRDLGRGSRTSREGMTS
jgi:hypothetical protein